MARKTGNLERRARSSGRSLRYHRDALLQLSNTPAVREATEKFKVLNGNTGKPEVVGKRKRSGGDEVPSKSRRRSKAQTKSSRPMRRSPRFRKPSESTLSHTSTSPAESACVAGTKENESAAELDLVRSASIAKAAVQLLASQSNKGKLASNVNNTSVSADQKGDNAHSTTHKSPKATLVAPPSSSFTFRSGYIVTFGESRPQRSALPSLPSFSMFRELASLTPPPSPSQSRPRLPGPPFPLPDTILRERRSLSTARSTRVPSFTGLVASLDSLRCSSPTARASLPANIFFGDSSRM
ncbi:hypothetical protein F5Y03DRAFT_408680 [Xylaria venustula]|nr:hypothetical protein F5Y03DRAFT_408680 [Xylaria venustula]